MERLASLISREGTTMQEIVRAVQSGTIARVEMALVVASNYEAGGIEKARALGVPVEIIDRRDFPDSEAREQRLHDVLHEYGATIVTQNGWRRKTGLIVVEDFSGRIFNQHNGPPNYFGGKGMMGKAVHCAVLEFQRLVGRRFDTFVVGQHCDEEYDKGGVVQKQYVEVRRGDTAETLHERALPIEHRVQIKMLQALVRGTLRTLHHERLVDSDEEELLVQAKAIARERYPNG